jgi:hypothetical protein
VVHYHRYAVKFDIDGEAAEKVRELAAAAAALSPTSCAEAHHAYTNGLHQPHTTVKYWFKKEDGPELDALWQALKVFAESRKPAQGTLVGVGNFCDGRVVFCGHERSDAAAELVRGTIAVRLFCSSTYRSCPLNPAC